MSRPDQVRPHTHATGARHDDATPATSRQRGNADPGIPGAAWEGGLAELEDSQTYWMGTVHPSGRPHVVPVLAVVHDGSLYIAAGPRTRKARNLVRNPAVTVTTYGEAFDVVLEGQARRVTDDAVLTAVAGVYATKYG